MKRKHLFWIVPGATIFCLILFVILFFVYLTIVEYRPKNIENVPFTSGNQKLQKNKQLSIMSWNIGYCGLGKDEDFFMDGGQKVHPDSKKVVENYFQGIAKTIDETAADLYFIQEVDVKSSRTWKINQFEALKESTKLGGSFAYNYKCNFVPYPIPPMGRVESGFATFSDFETTSAQRYALPVPFKWPVRLANLKRCILAERIPVYTEDGTPTGNELVLANFHLEAFDNGEGKIAQTKALKEFIDSEYAKGNYVIAGGDFNQNFPGAKAYPVLNPETWKPGKLEEDMLDEGWQFAFDDSKPTCRANGAPYNDENAKAHNWQYFVIDGFIISPNIEKISVQVLDKDFQNSDHNPVYMNFILK